MKYETVLVTGASGKLGKVLVSSLKGRKILAPTHSEMDITSKEAVDSYFTKYKIDAIIHCAALTNMKECENDPAKASRVNIRGTANIAEAAISHNARLIYISTDYVYPCTKGSYKETDATAPFTAYGWSKLGGECVAKLCKNHCIMRTSFFDPAGIVFDSAPDDAFCSKISFSDAAKAIAVLLESDFIGIINVGRERISLYDLYKQHRADMKPQKLEEVNKTASIKRAADSSLDISLWRNINGN